jgi:hypothetical protein
MWKLNVKKMNERYIKWGKCLGIGTSLWGEEERRGYCDSVINMIEVLYTHV